MTLDKLRDIGVGIALDDFGTGYSSLSYLSRFHFDKIKIAQDFIKELAEKSDSSLAIVRSIVALGASLGIATTAEGVETLEQFERVRREGCTEVQGYYISRRARWAKFAICWPATSRSWRGSPAGPADASATRKRRVTRMVEVDDNEPVRPFATRRRSTSSATSGSSTASS